MSEQQSVLWRKIDDLSIAVNLDKQPRRIREGDIGWTIPYPPCSEHPSEVVVELRGEKLFVEDHELVMHVDEHDHHAGETFDSWFYDIQNGSGIIFVHPNVRYALLENTHLLPKKWERKWDTKQRFFCCPTWYSTWIGGDVTFECLRWDEKGWGIDIFSVGWSPSFELFSPTAAGMKELKGAWEIESKRVL
ncbi:hypothetical protein HYV70_04255 [Candidatus Uhrbacteria bacterium]|nr:hypothetical protein [Candidatus Uhrbacteria bacterium]